MNTAAQFGAAPAGEELQRLATSPHYQDGRFANLGGVEMEMKFSDGFRALYEMLTATNTRPTHPLPTAYAHGVDASPLTGDEYAVTWFGHSAILLELDGKRLLIDPMLGPAASPLPIFGKRFALQQPLPLDDISDIDAVLISHDHYDHLDYTSILALASRVKHFYVPLGVGSHLRRWGIPDTSITELDWWDDTFIEGIHITAAPAQHFSGRGLNDRNKTLWASWIIKGARANIYFSGDSGYGSHFREIGERFGSFDFTMMECGQYNEKWRAIHSMPEESVLAHRDLRGDIMMPIHWGAFTLAPHRWTEPVERVASAAAEHGVRLATPVIGQRFIPRRSVPSERWWSSGQQAR